MPNTPSPELPTAAVLLHRWLDLETMTALQMRNIDAVRRMVKLMFDSTETITERQAAFLKASIDQMNESLRRGEGASDQKSIFEQQAEVYRDIFGSFTTHVGELSEITSRCCAGLVQEATGNIADGFSDDTCCEPQTRGRSPASRKRSGKKRLNA